MNSLLSNTEFQEDYNQLREVRLNPDRHEARNAYEHCEMVRSRVLELAEINNLRDDETILLENVALGHDIGKITGTSSPSASVQILHGYHTDDEKLLNLVKNHDINLPWYHAHLQGRTPSENDWKKLAKQINLKLLCIFMIADRVDCPGGWRRNQPLVWFLSEVRKRKLVEDLIMLENKISI
jgi:hypothetical protein